MLDQLSICGDMRLIALVTVLSLPLTVSKAQAPAVPPFVGTITFAVANGNCFPATVTANAGRNAIVVKLNSSATQKIALVTTDSPRRHLLEHDQVGTSERWMSSVMLTPGSYELVSSLGGNKCSLTVN